MTLQPERARLVWLAMETPKLKPGQRVIVTLRKMIASGELKSGERIAEIPTAEALGVSRMPVRTALRALEQEGLVVKLGARGYAARGVAPDQVHGAIEVRGVLEGFAARRAAELGLDAKTEAALAACLALGDSLFALGRLEEGDLDRYHVCNLAFHDTLVAAARNPAIEDALRRNNYQPFAAAGAMALDWNDLAAEFRHLEQAHRQHHAVFDAVRRGDADAAETIMRDHAFAAVRNAKVFERLGVDAHTAFSVRAIRAD
jgi:GntR family transcriptional regulator of vanillate catabolism